MLKVTYKIEGEKPDLPRILTKINNQDYTIQEEGETQLLTIIVQDHQEMHELLRRLKPKKNRRTTKITITQKSPTNALNAVTQKFRFDKIGYKTRVQKRGYSFFVSLNKLIALGNDINKGSELYAYIGQDTLGRNMLILYLDGNPKNVPFESRITDHNTFIEQ